MHTRRPAATSMRRRMRRGESERARDREREVRLSGLLAFRSERLLFHYDCSSCSLPLLSCRTGPCTIVFRKHGFHHGFGGICMGQKAGWGALHTSDQTPSAEDKTRGSSDPIRTKSVGCLGSLLYKRCQLRRRKAPLVLVPLI